MASSLRHVASPRSLRVSSALNLTPKLNYPDSKNVRRSLPEEFLSQNSTPRNSTFSPLQSILSPEVSSILLQASPSIGSPRLVVQKGVRKIKSVRKLAWSGVVNVGTHLNDDKNNGEILAEPLPYLPSQVLQHDDSSELPSVSTPDRKGFIMRMQTGLSCGKILGKGSFGTVLKSTYRGKVVAVKVVALDLGGSKQLESESNALQLSHQNIVRIFKVVLPTDELNGLVIMELVTGVSLQKLLDLHPFEITSTLRIRYSTDISHALQYCHSQGVLHLDVKPKNILIDVFTNVCKLCDFGSSTQVGAKATLSLKGTVAYLAPELLCGGEPTTAADIYSLGVTMWQIMSGENPYDGYGKHTVIYKVVSHQYRPALPAAKTAEDETFIKIFMKCWAHLPQNRPSLQQLISELTAANQKPETFVLLHN